MAMLAGLTVLLGCQLVGDVIVHALAVPLPGSVVGLVLLYAALALRGGVPAPLRATSSALLDHLMLFLVPATTGLMLHLRTLGDEGVAILVAAIGGTGITMLVAAATVRSCTRKHLDGP
jgi:holin-like protein